MTHRFRLFWFRETGDDLGAVIDAEGLDPAVRDQILALTTEGDLANGTEIDVYLPFLDRRECKRRQESLRDATFERHGNVIRYIAHRTNAALRNHAAQVLRLDGHWRHAPKEYHARYFAVWRQVALRLQRVLRRTLLNRYLEIPGALENREESYPVLVYAASRVCFGRPRTEFTYDIADPDTLDAALRMTGQSLKLVLADMETRLVAEGRPAIARRYAPVWHEDIRREVVKHPRAFLEILGDEATFINSVIDLGTSGRLEAIKPFTRTALGALRNVHRMDLRNLAIPLLNEASLVLAGLVGTQSQSPDAPSSKVVQEERYLPSSAAGTSGHCRLDNAASR